MKVGGPELEARHEGLKQEIIEGRGGGGGVGVEGEAAAAAHFRWIEGETLNLQRFWKGFGGLDEMTTQL